MAAFIQFVGGALFAIGLPVTAFAALFIINGATEPGTLIFAASAASSLVSGAVLYCFGAMVDNLQAIRKNTERTVELAERAKT